MNFDLTSHDAEPASNSEPLHTGKSSEIRLPPVLETDAGTSRHVGVEIEFCGLELDEITARIKWAVGGKIQRDSEYQAKVLETSVGTVRVELDAGLFRDLKVRRFFESLNLEGWRADLGLSLEQMMATEVRRFVPFEVVFDPIPIPRIVELEAVRRALAPGSEGTRRSMFNAFGLHLNPELPRLDATTILRYLQAFLVLYEELKLRHKVDVSREFSPFIDAFPELYVSRVLQKSYTPTISSLMDTYLKFNPTRNRPLDLLPVLAWIDEDRVRRALPKEKIGKRPALHYRLPNSQMDEADWSITQEWNHWVQVEILVSNPDTLARRCRELARDHRGPLGRLLDRVQRWWGS
jgi:hypothetical protein